MKSRNYEATHFVFSSSLLFCSKLLFSMIWGGVFSIFSARNRLLHILRLQWRDHSACLSGFQKFICKKKVMTHIHILQRFWFVSCQRHKLPDTWAIRGPCNTTKRTPRNELRLKGKFPHFTTCKYTSISCYEILWKHIKTVIRKLHK